MAVTAAINAQTACACTHPYIIHEEHPGGVRLDCQGYQCECRAFVLELQKVFEGQPSTTVHYDVATGPAETPVVGSDVVVNAADGKQSRLDARYDLIPPFAEEIVAQVLAEGAAKYDAWNWLKIPSGDHLNHARQHIAKFIQGDTSEDHAAHAATRIWFWLDALKRENKR